MNKELKQKIKEAAIKAAKIESLSGRGWADHYFVKGAEYLYNQGYRFRESDLYDLAQFIEWRIGGFEHEFHVGEWLKERESK